MATDADVRVHVEAQPEGAGQGDEAPLASCAVRPLLTPIQRQRPLWDLRPYLLRYPCLFWWSCANAVGNKVFDLAPPIVVGWVIDTVSGQPPPWIREFQRFENKWTIPIVLCVLVVLIHVFESLFQYFYELGFLSLAQKVQHDLRLEVFDHIQHREMRFFAGHRLGDTLSRLNDDVNTIERFCNTGFVELLQLVVLMVFAMTTLFSTSWELALIGLVPLPFVIASSLWYHRSVEPKYRDMRHTLGELTSRLENSISGILVVKSFTAEKFEYDRVSAVSAQYRDANISAIKITAAYTPIIRMLIALAFAAIVLFGSFWVLNGEPVVTVGEFVLFCMLIQRALWPLTRLGTTLDNFERSNTAARRTLQLLDSPSEILDEGKSDDNNDVRAAGHVEFRDISFGYQTGRIDDTILNGLQLQAAQGEFLGIVGTTGAGKSTLVKLLMRLYDPQRGQVLLDGQDIRELSLQRLRRNIALVSQDIYLFHGTILQNIAYGCADTSLEEVRKASKMAQFDAFVQTLPDKYETKVGERGIKLSGGQRQRLSIARALLKDAPIMILDEATSAVDTETERAIQQHLAEFITGRTALVIAHRLSTIRHASRIVVLDGGRVVEAGTHEELIKLHDGVYRRLWNVQSGQLD